MTRPLLYALAGLLVGLAIHLIVILTMPALATRNVWNRIEELSQLNAMEVLDPVAPGAANPLRLDPELAYGVCRLNLAEGPGVLTGRLPAGVWSVAVFDRSGRAIYSTTNRDGIGQQLDLGIFNPAQTRLLAEQRLDITEGLVIIESAADDVFVVVRVALPYVERRPRYAEAIKSLSCGAYR